MNEVRYAIVNLLRVAQSFPAAPRIMAQLGRLLHDPDATLDEVTVNLKLDPTLAAKLLRMANSAAFAQGNPVSSITDAAALIGLREIHRLVGAAAIDHFSQRNYPVYGFTGARLRDNSILVALLMEELAPAAREDPSTAYSAGLFRSLGKLSLAKIADEHAPAPTGYHPAVGLPLVTWEKQAFGVPSNEAATAILKEWQFPTELAQAIGGHYTPVANERPLTGLLNLAAGLAEQLGHGLPGETSYWLPPEKTDCIAGLGAHHIERATERAVIAFDRINLALGSPQPQYQTAI